MTEPVVVTGIGAVAPNGSGTDAYWDATLRGRSGIRRITRFEPDRYPVQLAGEIVDYDPAPHVTSRLVPQTDQVTRLALGAADWALADAGAGDEVASLGAGVVTANGAGGFGFGHRELERLWSRGPDHVSAYQSFAWFYAVNSGQISIRHGMRGASGVLVTEQAGGIDALGKARRQLRRDGELVVSGAVDSALCPWGWVAEMSDGRMSDVADPRRAYLPFDAAATGHVVGEGGALLVLEEQDAARARGVTDPYGEIAGYAATTDPAPGSGRPPTLRRAAELALDDAGADPGDVDVVFADAAGSPDLDRAEAEAISAVFGAGAVPVTVPKTMTGRLSSGGSALDVATALLALRDGVVPGSPAELTPGHDLDVVVGDARPADLRTALVLARGRDGLNAAMVVRRPGGRCTDSSQ